MNTSNELRIFLGIITVIAMSGCSMPMRVNQINSVNDPAKGIRYIVKRPGYEVGIRLDNKIFTTLNDDSKIDKEVENCFSENPNIELIVEQNLKGKELTYEITTPSGLAALPHIFSDTRMTVKTEADGTLQAVSAGETDKFLEFLQAVAGLAISAAKPAIAPPSKPKPIYCAVFNSDGFKEYAKKHLTLSIIKESLSKRLTEIQRDLRAQPVSALAESSKVIEFLRSELDKANESLKTVKHTLKEEDYSLTVDGKTIVPISSATSWLQINLTK